MWIVLLDRSGSMGESFHGSTSFRGRASTASADVKLQAAKHALRERLAGMRTTVAVFAFDDRPELVYGGPSDDDAAIGAALARIVPGGWTNVAAALDAARNHALETRASFPLVVLVVTDGLDDAARAEASARALAHHGAVINVLLIDPTPDGERLARAISIHGEVQAVTTAAGLRRSVDASADREADLAGEARRALDGWKGSARPEDLIGPLAEPYARPAAPALERAPAERLGFTAGTPAVISPRRWESLFVCLHLTTRSNEVAEMLRKRIARSQAPPAISNGLGPPTLSKGASLRLRPRAEHLEFNPATQDVVWNEDIQTHEFRYRARPAAAGKPVAGAVESYALVEGAAPTLVGLVGFSVQVRGPGVPVTSADDEVRAHASMTFESVFASHASKDKPLVQACVASYQALGIRVYIDSESLRASGGEIWWPLLQGMIRRSDLFMLYWSRHAEASEVVRAEWQYALDVAPSKGDRFVRPVVWEPDHPAPPAALAHLHFARLDLDRLRDAPRLFRPDLRSAAIVVGAILIPLLVVLTAVALLHSTAAPR